jgi:hypothetical protein
MSNYPSSLDSFVNPTTNDFLNSPNHVSQHSDINDAVEALEAKLGITASTPTAGKLLRGTGAGTSEWDKDAPSGTIVGTTDTQTLTNKTLTSPTINTAVINNPTLATDTIAEYTSAAGVTIDGLLIKDSKLATNNSVVTANITNDAVTDDKLDYPRWWQELGRTTLSSAGGTITVSSLPARKYLKIMVFVIGSGGAVTTVQARFNNDSSTNYSRRTSVSGAADATATAGGVLINATGVASGQPGIYILDVLNYQTMEKICYYSSTSVGTAGSGTAPDRNEGSAKWVNTTNQINRVDVLASANSFAIGSEVVVLGHD